MTDLLYEDIDVNALSLDGRKALVRRILRRMSSAEAATFADELIRWCTAVIGEDVREKARKKK